MSVRTDVINLNVNVNGNAAQKQLNDLRKKAADVKFEMDGLKKGTEAYIAKKAELASITTEMDKLKKSIGITSLTQKELVKELNTLKALKGSVVPFSQEFKELDKQIKAVESRLYDVRNGVQGFSSFFSKIGDQVKQFGVLAAGYLGFQFLTQQFTNIISRSGKLSDQLADLRRVTGLTAGEAENLNSALGKIDTRTSTEGLRQIAIISGKLGVAKKDILGFTQSVDQLVVSLGDELGDAGQITDQLGKILNVFDGTINGQNIKELGNAFIELANTGSSTGAFISDFDQRLSGLAKSSGISLGALSGLGAGLEELGGRVESSSTAIQKILITIAQDVPAAAKIAGRDVKEFTDLFARAPEEAILQFAEGLTKNKKSFSEITASFKDAGEEGARVIETLTKLGQSSDYLRQRIDLGKKSIQETSAITEAFNLKNQTFGAELDKLGKNLNRVFVNSTLSDGLKGIVSGLNELLTPTKNAAQEFDAFEASTNNLKNTINPLITRYDELKAKTNLNQAEHTELRNIINKVIQVLPQAATEFDKYGNAVDINRGKITNFLIEQDKFLKVREKDAIDQLLADAEKTSKFIQTAARTRNEAAKELAAAGNNSSKFLTEADTKIAQAQLKLITLANTLRDKYKTELPASLKDFLNQALTSAYGIDAIASANEKTADKSGQILKENTVRTIKKIQDEIKQLEEDFKNIDIKNTAALQANRTKRAQLEKELASLEGKKTTDDRRGDKLKKEAEEFAKELKKLRQEVELNESTVDEQEVKRIENKYADLLEKARKFYLEQLKSTTQFEQAKKQIEDLFNRELSRVNNNIIERNNAQEYEQSLTNVKDFYDAQRNEAAKFYNDGKITKAQYTAQLKQLDAKEKDDLITVTLGYTDTVKKAAEDVKNFRKQKAEQTTRDEVIETDKRIANAQREELAKLQRAVITAKPNSKGELEAKKALLDAQLQLELQNADITNQEKLLKEAEFQKAKDDLDAQYNQTRIQRIFDYVGQLQQAMQSFVQIINNREEAILQKEKRNNDIKRNEYKKQLDNKLLNQNQYQKKVDALQQQEEARQREIRRKAAVREKALSIFAALINVAQGITAALTAKPFGPQNFINAAIVGVLGGLQVAAIASQPLPELGMGEWIREGDKHSDPSGGIPVMIERDEAVISGKTMKDPTIYSITGNAAQITSALQEMNGANTWSGGAIVKMMANNRSIRSDMPLIMEQGGIVRPINDNANASGETNQLLRILIGKTEENTEAISTMKTKLKAIVVRKDLDKEEQDYNTAKKASGFS